MDYAPVGKEENIDGVKVYHCGSGKKALIILEDVFGIDSGRHKVVTDTYANMGYDVYLPELLDHPWTGGVDPPKIIGHIKQTLKL